MYASGNPFVPMTGFGIPIGAAWLAGYPFVALGVTVLAGGATAYLLFRRRSKPTVAR